MIDLDNIPKIDIYEISSGSAPLRRIGEISPEEIERDRRIFSKRGEGYARVDGKGDLYGSFDGKTETLIRRGSPGQLQF